MPEPTSSPNPPAGLGDAARRTAGLFAALVIVFCAGWGFIYLVWRVAKQLKLALPTSPTVPQTVTADQLTKESGQRFDQDFTASMLTAHQSMIAATRYEIAHGSAVAVVSLARQALPVLIKHLQMMRAAAASAG